VHQPLVCRWKLWLRVATALTGRGDQGEHEWKWQSPPPAVRPRDFRRRAGPRRDARPRAAPPSLPPRLLPARATVPARVMHRIFRIPGIRRRRVRVGAKGPGGPLRDKRRGYRAAIHEDDGGSINRVESRGSEERHR
jgi:hypothetical protein